MPIVDDVGYGEATLIKHQHFRAVVGMQLAIAEAMLNRNPKYKRTYRYMELTAGKGFVPESGERGSPLLFLDQVHSGKHQMHYRADFIDNNAINLEELLENIEAEAKKRGWGITSTRCHLYDYEQGIPLLLNSFGSG